MVILSRFSPKDSVFLQFVWFSLHEVSLRWTVKEKNLKLISPDCRKMHFRHSF